MSDDPTDPIPAETPDLVVPITRTPTPDPPAAAPPPPPNTPPSVPAEAPAAPITPAPDAAVHEVRITHGAETGSRRLVTRIGVVALVLALLGAGVVAVQSFGSSGGADSPEQAVEQLFAALGDEDMLGAAEVIEPAERRTMLDPAIDMMGELQRLRVLSDDFDLASVNGIDLEFSDLTLTSEPLGTGVTHVQVDGSMTTSGDVDELDLGPLVLENIPADELALMQEEASTVSTEVLDEVGLVAVERSGRWYVSLWYSVAEAARRSSDAPLPQFGAGPAPVGGATPEESVSAFAAAAADLDLGGVIAQLDPEETAALYDYAALFIDEADAAAAELRAEDPTFAISVDRLDLRSQIDGDDAVVFIDGLAISVTGVDGDIAIDTAADCLLFVADEWNPDGQCEIAQEDLSSVDEWDLGFGLRDLPAPSVRAHRVGDRWYLSPMSSLLLPTVEVMAVLEPDQLQRWVDDPEAMIDELPDVIGAAPESAGLATAGLGGILALGWMVEQSFEEVDQAFAELDGIEAELGDEYDLVQPGLTDLPPPLELEEPPVISLPPLGEPPVVVDQPPLAEPEWPETRMVWIAATDLAAGVAFDESDLIGFEVSADGLPGDAVVDLADLNGLMLAQDLAAGELLLFSMFINA